MKQGRLGYNSSNDRYGLLASDLWIDTDFTVEKVLRYWLMINGYGQEWR